MSKIIKIFAAKLFWPLILIYRDLCIFISSIDEAIRIRTSETGDEAI